MPEITRCFIRARDSSEPSKIANQTISIIESSIIEDSHPKPIFLYNESFSYHGNESTTERKRTPSLMKQQFYSQLQHFHYHKNGNATEKACTIMTTHKKISEEQQNGSAAVGRGEILDRRRGR